MRPTPRDARVLGVVFAVRQLALPALAAAVLYALRATGALVLDPVASFVIITQACVPSAQNLVLLLQLRDSTRGLAPRLARLLLQMYALAALPTALWLTVAHGVLFNVEGL